MADLRLITESDAGTPLRDDLTYSELGVLDTVAMLNALKAEQSENPAERRFLAGALNMLRMLAHYQPADGFQGVIAWQGEYLVGVNIAHVSKQKRGQWGRYVASHYAYTLPDYRRQGVAKTLFRHCEDLWRVQGAHRLKDLIGSWQGVYLHRSLGHTIWGLEKNGHLIIDHPLTLEFALDGVPTNVHRQNPDIVAPLPYSEGERLFREFGKGRETPPCAA